MQEERKAQALKEWKKKVEIEEQRAIERGSESVHSSRTAASKIAEKYRIEGGLSGDVDGLLKINKKGGVDW